MTTKCRRDRVSDVPRKVLTASEGFKPFNIQIALVSFDADHRFESGDRRGKPGFIGGVDNFGDPLYAPGASSATPRMNGCE